MVKSKNGSKKILKSFGREKRLVKSKDGDCISIIERYRKEFGSLKVTEVERLRKSPRGQKKTAVPGTRHEITSSCVPDPES